MEGLLFHTSRVNYKKILESGYLKSKYQVIEDNPSLFKDDEEKLLYGDTGPYDNPLLFFQLMFEDKIVPMSKLDSVTFFFDPLLMSDYGEKKLNAKKYKLFKDETKVPKTRVWFNPVWWSGSYTSYEDYISGTEGAFSVDYNPKITLEENIFLFNQAKKLHLQDDNLKYDTAYRESKHKNEVVIFEKEIKIEDYLLGIYIDEYDSYEKFKEKFPEYNIMNKNETRKFIKDFFKN
jgi:hypothetical protein